MKISQELGVYGEKKAVEYLSKNGYSIVDRNFHSRFGEIDIIAFKDEKLHFIEVKYSQKTLPTERITTAKLSKILKTIEFYMYKFQKDSDFQVDALLISETQLEFIENITF